MSLRRSRTRRISNLTKKRQQQRRKSLLRPLVERLEDRRLLAAVANDDPQTPGDPAYATTEDTAITVPDGANDLLSNDTGGGPLTLAAIDASSANGAAVVGNPDGSFTYDPTGSVVIQQLDEGQVITDSFGYVVTDSPATPDGLMNVDVLANVAGSSNNTAVWANIWSQFDSSTLPAGFTHDSDTETVFDYAGGGGDFAVNRAIGSIAGNGPGGVASGAFAPSGSGGSNYSIRARTFLLFNSAGSYTIAMGSDDGRQIELTEAAPGTAPGYSGFVSRHGQVNGPFSSGDSIVGFSGGTGHNRSLGVFTVAAGDILALDAFYYEGGGGDSGEISIATGAVTSFNSSTFSLLADGVAGVAMATTAVQLQNLAAAADSADVTITVTGVNDAPVAINDVATITEAADGVPAVNNVTGNVLSNDTDVDDPNSSLTAVALNGVGGNIGTPLAGLFGSITLNANGTFAYELDDANPAVQALNDGAVLFDVFAYTVDDNHSLGNAKQDSGTLTVRIQGANDAPVANDDPDVAGAYMVMEGGVLTIAADGVLGNDTDDDDATLGVASIDTTGTTGLVTPDLDSGRLGAITGTFYDLDSGGLDGNRTGNSDRLFDELDPYVGPGVSDFVLQRHGISPTGDAAGVITPRVDFGGGTNVTQGDGNTINRGGFSSGSVPPWQGLFNDLGLTANMDGDQIAATWSGKVSITTPGVYTFTTRSDDGSVLFINGERVVNNVSFQGMTNRSGMVTLAAGLHDISIGGFEGGGGAGFQASYSGPDTGNVRVIMPPTVLLNDVASPGTFVTGGLRGDYYDLNNAGLNGGFSFGADEWLLFGTEPSDKVVLESLAGSATVNVPRVDFGAGTENVPGNGAVLNRGGTGGNPFGGIGVNVGNDQIGASFDGFIHIDSPGDFIFTARTDDHGRFYVDVNNDGDFDDPGELVATRNAGGMANYSNGAVTISGTGPHAVKFITAEGGGGAGAQISWEKVAGAGTFAREIIPPTAFTNALVGDGSFVYDTNGQFESLAEGQVTTDAFTYTVRDANGATDVGTVTITVVGKNDAPIVDDGGPYSIGAGKDLMVDASGTVDVDTNDVLTYSWDLDQDGTPEFSTASAIATIPWMTIQSASTPLGVGVHTIDLIVNDGTVDVTTSTTLTISSTFCYDADGTVLDYTMRLNGATLEIVETASPANVLSSVPFAGVQLVDVDGFSGAAPNADTFRIDTAGGNPIPVGGVDFDGGDPAASPGDQLIVTGSFANVTSNLADSDSGALLFDGAEVRYENLELADLASSSIDDLVFNPPPGAITAELSAIGGGLFQLASTSGPVDFVTTLFAAPNNAFVFNGSGDESVSIVGTIAGGAADFTITGDDIEFQAGTISTTGDVFLGATADVTSTTPNKDVIADALAVIAFGMVDLETQVAHIEGAAVDSFDVENMGDLTVGGTTLLIGVVSQDDSVTISTMGDLVVEEDIVADDDVTLLGDGILFDLGAVTSPDDVSLTATTGNISSSSSAKDVFADALVATANSGAVDLETNIEHVEGSADTGFDIDNMGDLTIGDVGATVGVMTTFGPIAITTMGSLTVAEDVQGAGDVDLMTTDAPTGSQGISLLTTVSIVSVTSNVDIASGDGVLLEDSSTVAAANGQVAIAGDVGDADPGVGASILLFGTITTGTPGTVTGGPDSDFIDVDPGVMHATDSLTLDGAESGDRYHIQFGRLTGDIHIVDTGTSGVDEGRVDGTAADEMFNVHNDEPNGVVPQTGGFVENTTEAELVTYTTSLETLLVHGQDGEDMFDVQPSQSAEISINGGSPNYGDPLPNGGDKLDFDPFGNYFTIDGKTILTEGGDPDAFLPVHFANIEQLPLDPLGTDTLRFDFDLYDNATDQNLLSATEAGWTSVPQYAEYGVTGTFGWLETMVAEGYLDRGAQDDGAGTSADFDSLVRDSHFANFTNVFQTDIANGWYLVSAKLGDESYARNDMQITDVDSGRVMATVDSPLGEFVDVTFVVLVEDGSLSLQFESAGVFWVVNSLEIRPAELLTFGSPDPGVLVGDGETVDTFLGFEATPNALITLSTEFGFIPESIDVSPDFAGIQVRADGAGMFSYQVERPSGDATVLVKMQEVSGDQTGCLLIEYAAPQQWLFDLEDETDATESDYLRVGPDVIYDFEDNGFGWDAPLSSNGSLTAGAFTRATTPAGVQADARIDGHFSGTVDGSTFTAEVAPGMYWVNATIGDTQYARDFITIDVNGNLLADNIATAAGEYYHNMVLVDASSGLIELDIVDNGGDAFWVLNSIEIREASLVSSVAFDPFGSTPTADGSIDTITGTTTGLADGTLLTIEVDQGQIVAPSGAFQDVYAGTQVEVVGNAFSFDYVRPTSENTPVFSAEAVDGAAWGEGTPVVYAAPSFSRFDFNGVDGVTAGGFIGVANTDLWNPSAGFGWQSSPRAVQRGTTGYSVSTVDLYRDGAWESRGAAGARTFQVDVGGPGPFDVRAYIGDRGHARDQIQVQTEDGSTAIQATGIGANEFTSLIISGAMAGADGILEITFSDLGGDRYWVVNGVDIAPSGGLPGVAPLVSSFDASQRAANAPSITTAELESVRQAAVDTWESRGITGAQAAALRTVPIGIQNLDASRYLGLSFEGGVVIDDNGGGAGWNVNVHATPVSHQADLFTTVLHELGHQIGLADNYDSPGSLMFGLLGTGERRAGAEFDFGVADRFVDSLHDAALPALTDLTSSFDLFESESSLLNVEQDLGERFEHGLTRWDEALDWFAAEQATDGPMARRRDHDLALLEMLELEDELESDEQL